MKEIGQKENEKNRFLVSCGHATDDTSEIYKKTIKQTFLHSQAASYFR